MYAYDMNVHLDSLLKQTKEFITKEDPWCIQFGILPLAMNQTQCFSNSFQNPIVCPTIYVMWNISKQEGNSFVIFLSIIHLDH